MKVFISSVITGYELFREAAQQAIETLGNEAIRAEDLGASSSSPRVACLSGVRQADLVVLLMGSRYGATQQSGLSATHEEFREARDRKEIIAFVEEASEREADQQAFLTEVQDWQGGLLTQSFADPEALRRAVTRMLHDRLLEDTRGIPDPAEIRQHACSILPTQARGYSDYRTVLVMALAGAPRQILLRPAQIEGQELDSQCFSLALQGPHALFDRREGTDREIVDNALVLKQKSRSIAVHADGSLVLRLPVESRSQMGAIIEEDVQAAIERSLGFFNDVISRLDPIERIRHMCVAASILGSEYAGWRTRAEDARSPNSMSMNAWGREREPIVTPALPRAALRTQRMQIAEDLTVLLRRQFVR